MIPPIGLMQRIFDNLAMQKPNEIAIVSVGAHRPARAASIQTVSASARSALPLPMAASERRWLMSDTASTAITPGTAIAMKFC
jgi:hypothetical protein